MKPKILTIEALLLASFSSISIAQQPRSINEYSYDVGVTVTTQVQQNLIQSGIQLDEKAFLRGVQDVLEGTHSKILMEDKHTDVEDHQVEKQPVNKE